MVECQLNEQDYQDIRLLLLICDYVRLQFSQDE